MNGGNRRSALLVIVGLCVGLCAVAADRAPAVRFYVTSAAAALVEQGLAAAAPAGPEAAAFQEVSAPGIRFQMNEAQATSAPWIDSNGWRFHRGIGKANYPKLPAGSAPLAAAEAFAFGVDAVFDPDPADVQELGAMLRFLTAQDRKPLPPMANIAIVDDHSEPMEEILNMLSRRNLLYDVVHAPDRSHDLTVQLGSKDFPRESAADPSEFAARVRAKLGDDRRLVRLYGSSTTIAHLTGDGKHARLCLLNYARDRGRQGGGQQQEIRIRLRGRYRPAGFAAYPAAEGAKLADVQYVRGATEFTVPPFKILAVIDLDATK